MGGFQPMDQDGQVKDDCMVQQRNYRPLLPAAGKKKKKTYEMFNGSNDWWMG